MFSKADRKWKVAQGYELPSSKETGEKKPEEQINPSPKVHKPYLEKAQQDLKKFRAAEDAQRKLTRKSTFEDRLHDTMGTVTDTLVKALVQEAQHRHYEYVTEVDEPVLTVSDVVVAEPVVQTCERESQDGPDLSPKIEVESGSSNEVSEVTAGERGNSPDGEAASPRSPVLFWQSSPSKKSKAHSGYHVRVEKKKNRPPTGHSGHHGRITELELNRIVAVEPTVPCEVKIVNRDDVNLIVSTGSTVPPNTETITVTASDFKMCGRNLSMLRACELKKSEGPQGNIIEITLNKRYGERLGLSVEFENLEVTAIHEGGIFAMWNHNNPDKCVRVGSHILEANGKNNGNAEILKEMKDATYATMICLKIQCSEEKPEAIVEVEEEEDDPYDQLNPWKGKPMIPCYTQNDSYINQVWFEPSPKELEDDEPTPRGPGGSRKRRSDSCPPSPSKTRRNKPSLPPVNKGIRPNSHPNSRAPSRCNSAKASSRGGSAHSGCRDTSLPREPRSASVPRPMSSQSSIEKLPPLA